MFRIAWSLVLLGELTQLIAYRQLIFGPPHDALLAGTGILPVLCFWWLAVACLAAGWMTRPAVVP